MAKGRATTTHKNHGVYKHLPNPDAQFELGVWEVEVQQVFSVASPDDDNICKSCEVISS